MPYVNFKVTKEGVTAEQKRRLIDGTTELLQKILNKDPHTTRPTLNGYRGRVLRMAGKVIQTQGSTDD